MNKFINLHPHEVPSVLSGHQTQFCRVVKPQPPDNCTDALFDSDGVGAFYDSLDASGDCLEAYPVDDNLSCPLGKPGDVLVGRECFNYITLASSGDPWMPEAIKEDKLRHNKNGNPIMIFYKADDEGFPPDWISSTHLPKELCRIHRPITRVRVMQLSQLTDDDLTAQGIQEEWGIIGCSGASGSHQEINGNLYFFDEKDEGKLSPDEVYQEIWNTYNALPRPVRKNNQIDHYESYPWEDITETRQYRGKDWLVMGCPWCWIIDVENIQKVT